MEVFREFTTSISLSAEGDKYPVDLSIIIPILNEEGNVDEMQWRLDETLPKLGKSYEIIYVDDGSTDRSFERLFAIKETHPEVKLIQLSRNFGQTAAIAAGIDHSRGGIIALMDGDLQNDPTDLETMLVKLDEGYDLVSGWRKDRRDKFLSRKLPSHVANRLISKVTGVHLHDYGCTLKVYRREVLKSFRLYGGMHRFLPAYAFQRGARITEIPVKHHPRSAGQSKYGFGRFLKVILDLVTVKFMSSFAVNPIYLFGGVGVGFGAISMLLLGYLGFSKFYYGASFLESPLLVLSAMTFLLGLMLIFIGLIAELVIRTYYESQGRPHYMIRSYRKNS